MVNTEKFSERFKELRRTPEILAVLILLVAGLAYLVVVAVSTPGFLVFVGLAIFLGLVPVVIRGFIDLGFFKSSAKQKDAELRAVIENLNDAVIIYDQDFRIMEWNKAAEAIFELKKSDIVGERVSPDSAKFPRLRALTQVLFPSLAPTVTEVSGGPPQIVDIILEEPSLKLRSTLHRIPDETGVVKGFLKIVQDLSRERQVAESKSEFLTVAAHQLRTPLTAIKWSFETILGGAKEDDSRENAKKGLELAERMIEIVNDLLDAARIEEGKFGYKFEETGLVGFVEKVVAQATIIAEEYGIKIDFTRPKKDYRVMIDKERLGIVLTNLLDNAIRYNVKGGSVSVSLEETGKFVRVNVRDTGVGIPPGELSKVFEKFHRGKNVVEIEPNGSGLGLYITKNIVKGHGGEIGVESDLGRGSNFWFTLPLDFSFVPEKKILYE
ncbi:MAG TPA: ATP-binding protein [Candidatus Paceibacterota bacterium]|nr:ATP-binding protein [Candidatus Paceibacterota bacterium]